MALGVWIPQEVSILTIRVLTVVRGTIHLTCDYFDNVKLADDRSPLGG